MQRFTGVMKLCQGADLFASNHTAQYDRKTSDPDRYNTNFKHATARYLVL
jgi:hypothetical protein